MNNSAHKRFGYCLKHLKISCLDLRLLLMLPNARGQQCGPWCWPSWPGILAARTKVKSPVSLHWDRSSTEQRLLEPLFCSRTKADNVFLLSVCLMSELAMLLQTSMPACVVATLPVLLLDLYRMYEQKRIMSCNASLAKGIRS